MIKFQNDSYKQKVIIAKNFINDALGKSIEEFILENAWDENLELCINVINNSLTPENLDYIRKNLNLPHLRDKRTPEEYACDLILGWVIEDSIVAILKHELQLNCSLESLDKNRKFLKRPKATADLKLELNAQNSILIEIVKDYTGYWTKNNKIDLRDNKYLNLKKEKSILLGIDFLGLNFFILPVVNADYTYMQSHFPYGGKPAYALSLKESKFHSLKNLKIILKGFFQDQMSE